MNMSKSRDIQAKIYKPKLKKNWILSEKSVIIRIV